MNDANLPPETDAWLDKIILEHGAQIAAKMRAPAPQTAGENLYYAEDEGLIPPRSKCRCSCHQTGAIHMFACCRPDPIEKPSGEQAEARVERVAHALAVHMRAGGVTDWAYWPSELKERWLALARAALAAAGEKQSVSADYCAVIDSTFVAFAQEDDAVAEKLSGGRWPYLRDQEKLHWRVYAAALRTQKQLAEKDARVREVEAERDEWREQALRVEGNERLEHERAERAEGELADAHQMRGDEIGRRIEAENARDRARAVLREARAQIVEFVGGEASAAILVDELLERIDGAVGEKP